MSGTFNINVSGGNVSLGAAAQGDHSTTTGTASMQVTIEAGSEAMFKALSALAQQEARPPEAVVVAKAQAQEVVQAVKAQDSSKVVSALDLAQKHCAWAYPIIKDFLKVAWPAVLAVIGL